MRVRRRLQTIQSTGTPPSATPYTLVIGFQRGKYTAAIAVGSYGNKPTMSTVLGLAKLVDSRIGSHG